MTENSINSEEPTRLIQLRIKESEIAELYNITKVDAVATSVMAGIRMLIDLKKEEARQ